MPTNKSHNIRRRMAIWGLVTLLAVLVLPVLPYAYVKANEGAKPIPVPNPATDLWREVRQRDAQIVGTTQVRGMDAGTLINTKGEAWRQFRRDVLIPNSAWYLGGILALIVLFRIIRGKIKLEDGPSDQVVPRFTITQRSVHWTVATLFVILGLTGVILLYGRFVLIPVLGPEGFGTTAFIAKRVHDFVGPAFGIMLIVMFFLFIKGNIFDTSTDPRWIIRGGGMFGKHAPAHRYNFGEKAWFWIAMIGGGVIVYSGVILHFPYFGQDRATMEWYQTVHTISALVVFGILFGHIYMGLGSQEGALEGMATGYSDANWAKEHHDLWYQDLKAAGKVRSRTEIAASDRKTEGGVPDPSG